MENYNFNPTSYDDFAHNAKQLAYKYEGKTKCNNFHWWMWEIGLPYAIYFNKEGFRTSEEIDKFMQERGY